MAAAGSFSRRLGSSTFSGVVSSKGTRTMPLVRADGSRLSTGFSRAVSAKPRPDAVGKQREVLVIAMPFRR